MLNANGLIFKDEQGIFPVIHFEKNTGKFRCLGTSFLINGLGIFVTAKHVIQQVADRVGESDDLLMLVQHLSNKESVSRMVTNLCLHPKADIAVGMVGIARHLRTAQPMEYEVAPSCRVSFEKMEPGCPIMGFGYPKTQRTIMDNLTTFHLKGKWSEGLVEELHPNGLSLLQNSCYQTTMHIESGSSGGPVFNDGYVVGINSSSFELTGEEKPISFITPISYVLDLQLSIKNDLKTIRDLVSEKAIIAKL